MLFPIHINPKVIKDSWPECNLWYLKETRLESLGICGHQCTCSSLWGKKASCEQLKKLHKLWYLKTWHSNQKKKARDLDLSVTCSPLIQEGMKVHLLMLLLATLEFVAASSSAAIAFLCRISKIPVQEKSTKNHYTESFRWTAPRKSICTYKYV